MQTFLRGVQVVEYDRQALADIAAHVVNLSEAEDLPGHGDAVKARFVGDEQNWHSDWTGSNS